jgi:hypothetical protein
VDYNFKPSTLVLVRKKGIEGELDCKTKLRYTGPMVVVRRNRGGGYVLAEIDGSLSRLRFGATRLVPYLAREDVSVDISHLTSLDSTVLHDLTQEPEPDADPLDWDVPDPHNAAFDEQGLLECIRHRQNGAGVRRSGPDPHRPWLLHSTSLRPRQRAQRQLG